ncbi:MAG: Hsp70 family protein [Pirellulaceae bacterium]
MTSSKHPAVGIDLGTTFSAIAYLDSDGRPQTVRNAEGDLTTPSAVYFDRQKPVVGLEALEAGIIEPQRLATFAKRNTGEVAYEKMIRQESLPPEVIQSFILKKLIEDAEPKLGRISKAVVTVPAFFNEPCRKATQDAGRLIGLEVLDIINEPTAAAITFGVETGFLAADGSSDQLQRVLVYDLGGGTFDVTIMEIQGKRYHAIATAGDVYLGGMDWDARIVDYVCEQFIDQHDCDPRDNEAVAQELLKKANQAKHALCQRDEFPVVVSHEGHRFKITLTRDKFEFLTSDLVDRTILTVRLAMRQANLNYEDLSRILLVGGSTRMPMIQKAVESEFGRPADRTLSPDEAISQGAAIYAGLLLNVGSERIDGISIRNVNSHDLGVLAIESSTGRPRRQIMIPRNNPLPAKRTVRFRTHQDNQHNVKIQIVEGGDDSGNDATQIGKCIIDDLPKNLPQGTSVDVQFRYESDGRLQVTASMPEIEREVRLSLNRDAGLKLDSFDYWQQRIAEGMPDSSVASKLPTTEEETSPPIVKDQPAEPIEQAKPVATFELKKEGESMRNVEPAESDESTSDESSAAEPVVKPASTTATVPEPKLPDFSSLRSMSKKNKHRS